MSKLYRPNLQLTLLKLFMQNPGKWYSVSGATNHIISDRVHNKSALHQRVRAAIKLLKKNNLVESNTLRDKTNKPVLVYKYINL